MPCEMHVGTEHHSITVCFKIEQMGTSETFLKFDVQRNITRAKSLLHFQIFVLLRKSLLNRKDTEGEMYLLAVRENVHTKLF